MRRGGVERRAGETMQRPKASADNQTARTQTLPSQVGIAMRGGAAVLEPGSMSLDDDGTGLEHAMTNSEGCSNSEAPVVLIARRTAAHRRGDISREQIALSQRQPRTGTAG